MLIFADGIHSQNCNKKFNNGKNKNKTHFLAVICLNEQWQAPLQKLQILCYEYYVA